MIGPKIKLPKNCISFSCSRLKEELHLESDTLDAPPTTRQLLLTGVTNALPFIGFGFLDNAVMIVAVSDFNLD